jgi:hypothetical protein
MKRLLLYGAPAIVCLSLLLPAAALSGGSPDLYRAFNEETAVLTKNGAAVDGRVFTRTYDPEPDELFVLTGGKAYMLKTAGIFMQRMGLLNVYAVSVKKMDDAARPVMIDCKVGLGIDGSLLEDLGGSAYAFTVNDDRYEVRLAGPVKRDPKMYVNVPGVLESRTERVGTRSEGPEYYLRTDDGREIHVIKNAVPGKDDKALRKEVGNEVWIPGALVDGELIYKEVNPNVK